jgi:phytoene/squalene synthetase
MNFNEYKPIDLSTALTLADGIMARRSPKANFLLNMGVSKSRGQYLKLCFSYLRWVDDIVDDPKVNVSDKRNFINRQLKLISNYSNNIFTPIEDTKEAFLYYFIQYGLNRGNNIIIDSVRLMIEGLEMDVQRTERDGIFAESEMNTYINKMSKSFFDVTASFILSEGKYPYQDVIVTTASTKIWMIRDLLQDFESGYVNITREKLAQYNLISKNLPQNKNLKNYLESQINNIIRLLIDEAKIMKQFPIRLKLFNYYTQVYYLPKIFRVKAYGYNLLKVQNRKKLYNETVTYLLTFKLALKILFTEFYLCNSVK